jgi:hypothetical protein
LIEHPYDGRVSAESTAPEDFSPKISCPFLRTISRAAGAFGRICATIMAMQVGQRPAAIMERADDCW